MIVPPVHGSKFTAALLGVKPNIPVAARRRGAAHQWRGWHLPWQSPDPISWVSNLLLEGTAASGPSPKSCHPALLLHSREGCEQLLPSLQFDLPSLGQIWV